MLNDLILIGKIKEGDIKAYEGLFRLYYEPLCRYAVTYVNRMEIAEEIVQDLFYIFWKERSKLPVFQSLKAYLYGAVRNRSLQHIEHLLVQDKYREERLNEDTDNDFQTPLESLEYKELQERVEKTIQNFPERRQRIFRMHRFEGKKYTEISAELALSVKTIEAEMTKALQTLRKEIDLYIHTR